MCVFFYYLETILSTCEYILKVQWRVIRDPETRKSRETLIVSGTSLRMRLSITPLIGNGSSQQITCCARTDMDSIHDIQSLNESMCQIDHIESEVSRKLKETLHGTWRWTCVWNNEVFNDPSKLWEAHSNKKIIQCACAVDTRRTDGAACASTSRPLPPDSS